MMRSIAAALIAGLVLVACATPGPSSGWTVLIDGQKGLENFVPVGNANWRGEGGAIVADKAKDTSFLVSKQSYGDFALYAEFWADHTTNSGIFLRVSDPKNIRDTNSYEANIFDQRPGTEYATGAIVNFAQIPPGKKYTAGGKWNTYEIYAKGSEVTVKLNGEVTVHMNDSQFKSGPIALQYGVKPGGAIKWRKVAVKPL